MDRPTILLQLDGDPHPSSFDAVVAVDAGVDRLLQYGGVTLETVVPLIHGAMFTRGGEQLRRTALFVGGSDVAAAERLLERIRETFFGPIRVSVMMDANGCNTTAAAAVLAAAEHLDLNALPVAVLAGTGPVGRRVARLLAGQGARVRVVSRDRDRAEQTCATVRQAVAGGQLTSHGASDSRTTAAAIDGCAAVIACGAAGVPLLDAATLAAAPLRLAIDLNAVPPAGIEGIEPTDRGRQADGCVLYGAIGTGELKMKIHRAAIARLFEQNDLVLDAEEIFQLGQRLISHE